MRPLRHVRMQCVNKQKIRFGNDECLIFSKKQKKLMINQWKIGGIWALVSRRCLRRTKWA